MNLSRRFRGIAFAAAFLLPASTFAADFIDLRRIDPVTGDAKAAENIANTVCMACHGPTGVSAVPMFPDLAGQKADYLYHQLLRYKSGALPESPMTAIVAPYNEGDLRNFALHYAALVPATDAAPVVDQAAFDRGGSIFREGDTHTGIPPCQGCHGVNAAGVQDERFLAYPRLRHQKAEYIVTRLKDYRSGKLKTTSNDFIMQSVAHRLDDNTIAALAAWLASAP
jgi:cytochrome c553